MLRYYNRVAPTFARSAFMKLIGAELAKIEEGKACLRAKLTTELTQQHGTGHAGVSFTLGEVAAELAALTLVPEGREIVTSEMKINLLRPALGDSLEARASVLKAGRRLYVVRSDIFSVNENGQEVMVATMLGTMVPVDVEFRTPR